MEGRVLGWGLLLVGVMVSGGMAASHGGGGESMPDGCDQSAAQQCFTPFMPSGVLEAISGDNETAKNMSIYMAWNDPAYWTQFCGAVETALGCLAPQEKLCFSNAMVNFADLFHLNYTVLPSADLRHWRAGLCTNEMYCLSEVMNCTVAHKDILAYLESGSPDLTSASNCMKVKALEMCVGDHMPRKCRASMHTRNALKGIKKASDYCGEGTCQQLTACKIALGAAQPPPLVKGVDANTCSLYRNYLVCAGNVQSSSSCSDFPSLHGVNLTEVSDITNEACTAMAEEGINAIYSCDTFKKCVQDEEPDDSTFTPNVCTMVQLVLGCALRSVGECAGVNATKRPHFISAATALAHRAQALGCPAARVLAGQCDAVTSCSVTPGSDALAKCRAFATYQSCLGNAADSCNLTAPHPPPGGRPGRAPRMQDISGVTEAMCTALAPVLECPEFYNCTGETGHFEKPWERISGLNWCHDGVKMMECAMFFTSTCNTTTSFMDGLHDIYGRVLAVGCENTYMYVAPTPPTTTTEPTSGASRDVVAVSLLTLLFYCALFNLM